MEEPIVKIENEEMVLIYDSLKIIKYYDKKENKIIIIKDYFKEGKIKIEKI